jgi:hypothetical protein
MADRDKQNPETAEEADISTAQSTQQPPQAQKRTDIEGASLDSANEDDPDAGIIGSGGTGDTSNELIEDVEGQNFAKGGQGAPAPEGK